MATNQVDLAVFIAQECVTTHALCVRTRICHTSVGRWVSRDKS